MTKCIFSSVSFRQPSRAAIPLLHSLRGGGASNWHTVGGYQSWAIEAMKRYTLHRFNFNSTRYPDPMADMTFQECENRVMVHICAGIHPLSSANFCYVDYSLNCSIKDSGTRFFTSGFFVIRSHMAY
jgi:hypothetical protein